MALSYLATTVYRQLCVSVPEVPKVDLSGRVILVTGANSGIGLETAKHLIKSLPAVLVIGVRRIDAGERAKEEILSTLSPKDRGKVDIRVWYLDLLNFKSVKAFGERANSELERLDVYVVNAGINTGLKVDDMVMSGDGWERSVQTNTLSPMLLAFLLIPLLKRTVSKPLLSRDGLPNPWPPRIIFNGSRLHVIAEKNRLDPHRPLQGLNDASGWHNPSRYAITKLLNHLLAQSLIDKLENLIVVDAAPGIVSSGFIKDPTSLESFLVKTTGRTPEIGGRVIALATVTAVKSEGFWSEGSPEKLPLAWTKSPEGEEVQRNLWKEVGQVLEGVSPGCTAAVAA